MEGKRWNDGQMPGGTWLQSYLDHWKLGIDPPLKFFLIKKLQMGLKSGGAQIRCPIARVAQSNSSKVFISLTHIWEYFDYNLTKIVPKFRHILCKIWTQSWNKNIATKISVVSMSGNDILGRWDWFTTPNPWHKCIHHGGKRCNLAKWYWLISSHYFCSALTCV